MLQLQPNTDYELSTDGSDWSSPGSISLVKDAFGTVNTTVYVRLSSTASTGSSANIVLSSSGVSNVNVATNNATVNTPPTVSAGSNIPYSAGGTISFDATVSQGTAALSETYTEDFHQ